MLTLFPDMFKGVFGESIFKRALEQDRMRVDLINFRDYATDKHRTVDDYPFGGGAGMLLKPAPLFDAMAALRQGAEHVGVPTEGERVVMLSPQGRKFNQSIAQEFAQLSRLTLICGHYEGFDERVRQTLVTDEISIGDFVLTGGELAAMVVLDAVVRLLPGVLGNHESAGEDSFASGLLEYPQYTRPAVYEGMPVPPALLSGNHAQIAAWRRRHALYRTWVRRPDLLNQVVLTKEDLKNLERWRNGDYDGIDVLEPGFAHWDNSEDIGSSR